MIIRLDTSGKGIIDGYSHNSLLLESYTFVHHVRSLRFITGLCPSLGTTYATSMSRTCSVMTSASATFYSWQRRVRSYDRENVSSVINDYTV